MHPTALRSCQDLEGAVDDLVARMEAMESKQEASLAPVPGALTTLSASIKTATDSIGRIDDSVTAMQNVEKKVDSIPGEVNKEINAVKAKMVKLVADMAKLTTSVDDANVAALTTVNTKVAAAKVANAKGMTDLSGTIDKTIADTNALIAKAGSSESIYINWGSTTCEGKDSKKVYDGYLYASYHDSRGGTTPQCLKNAGGTMGGQSGSWDSLDWLYPAHLDHCSGTALQDVGHCNQNVPCSLCQKKKHCYLETGTNECSAKNYYKQYAGWLYGSYNGHNSRHQRICISEKGDGWGVREDGGSRFYPTLNNHAMDQRQGDQTIKCHWCFDDA